MKKISALQLLRIKYNLNVLKNILKCIVCQQLAEQEVQLICKHTICNKCYENSSFNDTITCEICEKVTKNTEVVFTKDEQRSRLVQFSNDNNYFNNIKEPENIIIETGKDNNTLESTQDVEEGETKIFPDIDTAEKLALIDLMEDEYLDMIDNVVHEIKNNENDKKKSPKDKDNKNSWVNIKNSVSKCKQTKRKQPKKLDISLNVTPEEAGPSEPKPKRQKVDNKSSSSKKQWKQKSTSIDKSSTNVNSKESTTKKFSTNKNEAGSSKTKKSGKKLKLEDCLRDNSDDELPDLDICKSSNKNNINIKENNSTPNKTKASSSRTKKSDKKRNLDNSCTKNNSDDELTNIDTSNDSNKHNFKGFQADEKCKSQDYLMNINSLQCSNNSEKLLDTKTKNNNELHTSQPSIKGNFYQLIDVKTKNAFCKMINFLDTFNEKISPLKTTDKKMHTYLSELISALEPSIEIVKTYFQTDMNNTELDSQDKLLRSLDLDKILNTTSSSKNCEEQNLKKISLDDVIKDNKNNNVDMSLEIIETNNEIFENKTKSKIGNLNETNGDGQKFDLDQLENEENTENFENASDSKVKDDESCLVKERGESNYSQKFTDIFDNSLETNNIFENDSNLKIIDKALLPFCKTQKLNLNELCKKGLLQNLKKQKDNVFKTEKIGGTYSDTQKLNLRGSDKREKIENLKKSSQNLSNIFNESLEIVESNKENSSSVVKGTQKSKKPLEKGKQKVNLNTQKLNSSLDKSLVFQTNTDLLIDITANHSKQYKRIIVPQDSDSDEENVKVEQKLSILNNVSYKNKYAQQDDFTVKFCSYTENYFPEKDDSSDDINYDKYLSDILNKYEAMDSESGTADSSQAMKSNTVLENLNNECEKQNVSDPKINILQDIRLLSGKKKNENIKNDSLCDVDINKEHFVNDGFFDTSIKFLSGNTNNEMFESNKLSGNKKVDNFEDRDDKLLSNHDNREDFENDCLSGSEDVKLPSRRTKRETEITKNESISDVNMIQLLSAHKNKEEDTENDCVSGSEDVELLPRNKKQNEKLNNKDCIDLVKILSENKKIEENTENDCLSDIDVVETTPQKTKNSREIYKIDTLSCDIISNSCSEDFNLPLNLPPPPGFEDDPETKVNDDVNLYKDCVVDDALKDLLDDDVLEISTPKPNILTSTPKQSNILKYFNKSGKEPNSLTPLPKKIPCISCTRLSKEQILFITSLTNKKKATYSSSFSSSVTHLIVSTDKNNCVKDHTIKYISSVAAGIWVLNFSWIQECQKQNCIVEEEPFEVLDISGASGPRTSRLCRISNPLFKDFAFYAAPPFSSTTKQDVENVIKLLSGAVVTSVDKLKSVKDSVCIIITEARATQDFEIYETWLQNFGIITIDIEWLTRSVGQYRLLNLRAFILCSEDSLFSLGYPPELIADVPVSLQTLE